LWPLTVTSANASSIACRSLSVRFAADVTAVDQVNLTIPAGEIVSLIGPSGCGKTTLLRLMSGLETATAGSVQLTPAANSRHGEIAFVFQQPSLLPWRSALENVLLPLQLIHWGNASRRNEAAQEILDTVQLSDARDRLPHQLSGGMKMRVSIARALVSNPKVLLLDEPFAALDDMLRNQLGQLILDLWQQRKFTAVMVTHNIAESIMLSHRIAVMRNGRVGDPIPNPLPRPRDESLRRSPEFGEFYGTVSDSLRTGQ
jgi:ABC-type nitrate/sulfonate/bicarbonate transport system ATPase subunit